MIQNLLGNKKTSGLVIAGIAAFALYKYSKLSPEQKSNLSKTIREKGKGFLDQFAPGASKTLFGDASGYQGFTGARM